MGDQHATSSRSLVQHVVKAHREADPEVALFQSRKAAETLCRQIFSREIGQPGKIMLDGMVTKLLQGKHIPQHIAVPLNTIRSYGNLAVHAQDDDQKLSATYVQPCLSALQQVVAWFWDQYLQEPRPPEVAQFLTHISVDLPPARPSSALPAQAEQEPGPAPESAENGVVDVDDSVARWRVNPDIAVTCDAVTRDGDRVLVGTSDGRVLLFDRSGARIWTFQVRERVNRVACCGDPQLFLVGTWGGLLEAYVNDGFEWRSQLDGVVSAIAGTYDGDQIAAGTWAGHVRLFRHEGFIINSLKLEEAVVDLAMDPAGYRTVAALADHSLVALDNEGEEAWRRQLDSRPLNLSTWRDETIVATVGGEILWLAEDGRTSQVERTGEELLHVAVSQDGSTVVAVDRTARFIVWERKERRWEEPLREVPDTMAIAGQQDFMVYLIGLPSREVLAINRRRREIRLPLPVRARSMRFSAPGIHSTCSGHDGELFFLELSSIQQWLSPPELQCRVMTAELAQGKVAQLCIDTGNEGGREARDVEIHIASEFFRRPRSATLRLLAPGQSRQVEVAVVPLQQGRVPVEVTLTCKDHLGEVYNWSRQYFVEVI